MNQSPPPNGDREKFEADLRTLRPTGSIDPLRLWQQHEQTRVNQGQAQPARTARAHARWKSFASHAVTATLSAAATLLLMTALTTNQPSPTRTLADRVITTHSDSRQTQSPTQPQPAQQNPAPITTPAPVDNDQESTISLDTWLNLAMRIPQDNATSPPYPAPKTTLSETAKDASIGGPAKSPSTWRQLALELRNEIIDPAL